MKDSCHHRDPKHDLMGAAIGVISEKRFDTVFLRGIAAHCGISHNAIYRQFSSREQPIARLPGACNAAPDGAAQRCGADTFRCDLRRLLSVTPPRITAFRREYESYGAGKDWETAETPA